MSCLLLAYSSYAVPMQLSFWSNDDPCNPFPTLYIDIFVDTFFMVPPPPFSEPRQRYSPLSNALSPLVVSI